MIKRTLYFTRPAYLFLKNSQLVASFKDANEEIQAPLQDLGFVVLDNAQITITGALLGALATENVAVISCDETHHPIALCLTMDGNQVQQERYRYQLDSSLPLKKRLWQQTISSKLVNQGNLLAKLGEHPDPLLKWAKEVSSGDTSNLEARGSRYYWPRVFALHFTDFKRDRFGFPPNNALNYGYAIIRAACARALVGSGLLPALGIHHRNRYNAYCLADDIMEPYRPFVDKAVVELLANGETFDELSKPIKARLLQVLTDDVYFKDYTSPLMLGLSETAVSLYKVYAKETDRIVYPVLQ